MVSWFFVIFFFGAILAMGIRLGEQIYDAYVPRALDWMSNKLDGLMDKLEAKMNEAKAQQSKPEEDSA